MMMLAASDGGETVMIILSSALDQGETVMTMSAALDLSEITRCQ